MANEQAIPYPIGTGSMPGDASGSSNGVLFNDEYDANYEVLSKLMDKLYYDGNNALDKASGAASCEIYLRTSEAAVSDIASRKGATAGQECRILYETGGNRYFFDVLVQEDGSGYPFIQFDSADVNLRTAAEAAAAIADYSGAAFIDALDIWTAEKFMPILSSDLGYQHDAAGTLLGTLIPTDNAASDKIGTEFATAQATVDAGLTAGTGVLKAGKAISTSLDKTEALSDDSPINMLLDGSTRDFLYGQDIAFGLTKYGLATSWAEETTIIPYAGKSTQEIVAGGSDVGVSAELGGDFYTTELVTENVTVVATVYSTAINNVKIGIEDDVTGLITDTPTLAATTWTEISYTAAVTAGATTVDAVILAAGAGTIYVTDMAMYRGDAVYKSTPSMSEIVIHDRLDNIPLNLMPFGDLQAGAWLNGTSAAPFPWTGTGTSARENTTINFGEFSWKLTLNAGEYFEAYIGVTDSALNPMINLCEEKANTFSLWLRRSGTSNTEDLDLLIEEYSGTWSTVESGSFEVNSYDEWAQIAVTGTIGNVSKIRVTIKNNGAAQIICFVDGIMYSPTAYPIGYLSDTPWNYHCERFSYPGSLADKLMENNAMAYEIPVDVDMIAYGMTVTEETSGTGTDSFYPKVSTVSKTDLQVDLGNGETRNSVHFSTGVKVPAESTLGVYCDADAFNAGSDAQAVVHCLIWGI